MRWKTTTWTVCLGFYMAIGGAASPGKASAIDSTYSITNLSQRRIVGINDRGQVALVDADPGLAGNTAYAGYRPTLGSWYSTGVYNSFGLNAGKLTAPPDLTSTPGWTPGDVAWASNNAGGTTGRDEQSNTYVNVGGVKTQIGPDTNTGYWSGPVAINNKGQVAGDGWFPATEGFHAFLFSDGVRQDLGTLGGRMSGTGGINDSGVVVGWSLTASPGDGVDGKLHAFLYDGTMHDLGGGALHAFGINNSGVIVGDMLTSTSKPGDVFGHAFMMKDGVLTDLNSLLPANSGWILEVALGINNLGQIVGVGELAGREQAFLLTPSSLGSAPPDATPIPEPASVVCFATLALAGLIRASRNRSSRERR